MHQKVKRKTKAVVILLITANMFFGSLYTNLDESKGEYFFTLVAKANERSTNSLDYLNLVKQQLERIGINIEVIVVYYPSFLGELIAFRDFDIAYLGLTGGGYDPDFTGLYNENGSLNLFGYHTNMDYNETLGTGVNEWFMKEGTLITPPNGEKRIQHYWNWQEYMMDKILPCYPFLAPKFYDAFWDTLTGYNTTKGILQSWGNMSWQTAHLSQQSTNEFVIADYAWSDLNPMFQDGSSSVFISKCIMDPLLYVDGDNAIYPHLVESYTFINQTHLRIRTRDGVQWQDYGDFLNEKFDAEDVYFTLYSWKKISNDQHLWEWIEAIEIVNENTVDIYIDGDPDTQQNEPYAPALSNLCCLVLPEHYLNQTQYADGVTPDITHDSWNTFATQCFGTGLFKWGTFDEGIVTTLNVNSDCWWLNSSITNDSNLNWNNRFGNFSDVIETLRIKIQNDQYIRKNLFLAGEIDFYQFSDLESILGNSQVVEHINYQEQLKYYLGFLAFNMRPVREEIGNPEPCEEDTTITKGLALRKAICYAIDREEINNIVHRGEYSIINHPIYERMGIWCKPDIITYDHDLEMAKYYMRLAGYNVPDHVYSTPENSSLWIYAIAGVSYVIGIGIIIFGIILLRKRRSPS